MLSQCRALIPEFRYSLMSKQNISQRNLNKCHLFVIFVFMSLESI